MLKHASPCCRRLAVGKTGTSSQRGLCSSSTDASPPGWPVKVSVGERYPLLPFRARDGQRTTARVPEVLAILLLTALLSFAAPFTFAQDESPELSAAKLAEEFTNPLTTLPQIFLQDAYTPATTVLPPRPTG